MDFQTENPSLLDFVRTENALAVRVALQKSYDIETVDSQMKTPLMLATENHNLEIASSLVKAGANVNAQDIFKNTPFLVAVSEGHLDLVKLMLGASPDFTVCNRFGGNALTSASERGHVEVLKALLGSSYVFDIDHRDVLGWTPLMEAVILGDGGERYLNIVELLIASGANPKALDREGRSCLDHAKRRKLKNIVKVLMKY